MIIYLVKKKVEKYKVSAGKKCSSHHQIILDQIADCCCSIVKSIEEAVNDHHFKVREIFSNKIVNNLGEEIPALPIPIDKQFRKEKVSDAVPKLGNANDQFL